MQLPNRVRRCPHCKSKVHRHAEICSKCQGKLPPCVERPEPAVEVNTDTPAKELPKTNPWSWKQILVLVAVVMWVFGVLLR